MKKKQKKKKDFVTEDNSFKKLPLLSNVYKFKDGISVIGAFNIHAFGHKKLENENVMRIIIYILCKYDIVLCQEVHFDREIVEKLVKMVSKSFAPYAYVISCPIGKHSYKESYLYLYKPNEWKLLDNYIVDNNEFAREPYVVQFQHWKKPKVKITLIGCHTKLENAYREIKALVTDVYTYIKKKSAKRSGLFRLFSLLCLNTVFGDNCEHIILMGDFNASGPYLNKTMQEELDKILTQYNLMWGINHSSNTAVASNRAAYDRFIFELNNKNRWVRDVRIWKYDDFWKNKFDQALTMKFAIRVSDHYPIKFKLKLK
ncbi:35906_t:CDS:1 [Gigaspora margarita]|uniref:35906_t:CDS:1 n=1 Tax=Gigaspora margarita TaxID=4874 RepID=A0ABN7V9Y8_GIGMA|nr:35906_t:CDS:1 [Gigaspora margarita]